MASSQGGCFRTKRGAKKTTDVTGASRASLGCTSAAKTLLWRRLVKASRLDEEGEGGRTSPDFAVTSKCLHLGVFLENG